MAITQTDIWNVFGSDISKLTDSDRLLVKAANGSNAVLILVSQARAYLTAQIQPSIGTDGYWYIGGVIVKDSSGNPIQTAGQTPTIALKTIGGIKAIYVTYKGASASDSDWTLLVTASDIMFTFDDLTEAQKQSFTQYFTDAITNCNNATSALKNMTSTYSKGELTITINY